MADVFDPYHKWLGILPKDQPPHHYRLLAIEPFESDPDVIESASDRQMAHLRSFQAGKHSADSQKLLNECACARLTLLNPQKKADYDRQLRQKHAILIDLRGELSPASRFAPGRRKKKSAWLVPAAAVAGAVALAIVLWTGVGPPKPSDESKQPRAAAVASRVSPETKRASTQSLASPTTTAKAKEVVVHPTTQATKSAAPPPIGPVSALVVDAGGRPETPGVIADRVVLWNLHYQDRGTREVNLSLWRDGREIWRKDAIEIPWSTMTPEQVSVNVPADRFDRLRVEITKWEHLGGGLAEIQVYNGDRNVALGCPASVAGCIDARFVAAKLTNGDLLSSYDGSWVLPNGMPGWAEVDLAFAGPRPSLGVLADKLVVWNAHNAQHNDHGALELTAHFFLNSNEVWRQDAVPIPWQADSDGKIEIRLPEKPFDRLRIEIPRWQDVGAGLSEVEVWRASANLARGCPVIASGNLLDAYVPAKVVDGISNSSTEKTGYWLARDQSAAWIEIDLSCNCPEIGGANQRLGRYWALAENDWQRGLPWLARGDDVALRTLADADTQLIGFWAVDESRAPAAVAVGDRWWDVAQDSSEPARRAFLSRAAYRYAASIPFLPEAERARLVRRVADCLPQPQGTWLYLLQALEVKQVFPDNNLRQIAIVGGVVYPWGLWMTPYPNDSAIAVFSLDGKYHRFAGAAAINDISQDLAFSPLTFKVLADGRELWASRPLQRLGESDPFELDVSGVDQLRLVVECRGSNDYCHAVWLDPVLDPPRSSAGVAARELPPDHAADRSPAPNAPEAH